MSKTHKAVNAVLAVLIIAAAYAFLTVPQRFRKDFTDLVNSESEATTSERLGAEKRLKEQRGSLEKEVSLVIPESLATSAMVCYQNEIQARSGYDKKYALTAREKSHLLMQSIASDSSRPYRDSIKAVAREASPKGADIEVKRLYGGMALHVDFDMSSVTTGELGTSTKHETIESLKKEVITLMSRVANDVYEHCGSLGLQSIYIGCRHQVTVTYQDGRNEIDNMTLYKVVIKKGKAANRSNDPYLDTYSVTEDFELAEDNFEELTIEVTTRGS